MGLEHADRPAATLLLVTYNQAAFVAAAFAAALAQDYSPLQIVVADDRSTDDTMAIVKALAADYDGPHQIELIEPDRNLGLFGNIQRAVDRSTGELIVIGAGDDIALPHRVSTMVAAWRATGAVALHSRYDAFKIDGTIVEAGAFADAPDHAIFSYLQSANDRRFIGGATSAYAASFLRLFPKTHKRIFHEDSMLSLAAHAMAAPLAFVSDTTVLYRVHGGSYSNRAIETKRRQRVIDGERSIAAYARDTRMYLSYLVDEWLPSMPDGEVIRNRINFPSIRQSMRRQRMIERRTSPELSHRVVSLFMVRNVKEGLAAIARLPGLPMFSVVKSVLRPEAG